MGEMTLKYAKSDKPGKNGQIWLSSPIISILRQKFIFDFKYFSLKIRKMTNNSETLLEGLNGGNWITLSTQFLGSVTWKRRFNTNSKKFTVTVIFIPERNKMGPEKNNVLCLVYHGVFGHLPTIPDYVMISEDYRRLTKMSEDRDIVACISGNKCEDYRKF